MTATEISQIVNNGYSANELDKNDYIGHVGIMIAHAFLHNIPMDVDVLSRYLKIESSDINAALNRLSVSGLFLPYSWLSRNRNAMLRVPSKKAESCISAWTHIAAIASGYVETLPNQRYTAASSIYKVIQSA